MSISPETTHSSGQIVSTLAQLRPTQRMQKLLAAYFLGSTTAKIVYSHYQKTRSKLSYSVSISDRDDIYSSLHAWLLDQIPEAHRRSLDVSTSGGWVTEESDDGDERKEWRALRVAYGGRDQTVELHGHKVRVAIENDHVQLHFGSESLTVPGESRIVFFTKTAEAQQEVLNLIERINRIRSTYPPVLRLASSYYGDGWHSVTLPTRTLDSVVLRKGQKEDLVEDLGWFLNSESTYNRLGVPWHRGYLFHGPPGTGKTSLARALATKFGLDVYYVPLADYVADGQLIRQISNINSKSLLLLEDIDVLQASTSRDQNTNTKTLSLSGLLNALDGVVTPHGLVTVMTTNDMSVLDPALLRPGRADRIEHLGFLDDEQLGRLAETMLEEKCELPPLQQGMLPATAVEALTPKGKFDQPLLRLRELILRSEYDASSSPTAYHITESQQAAESA